MRVANTDTVNALQAAPNVGIIERDLVYFFVRSLDGSSTEVFGFWNDIDVVTIPVFRGDTGGAENRNYVGDGSLLSLTPISLRSDLTIQSLTISLSQIHATVQNMVRGYDCRVARVEVHRVLFNPSNGNVVSNAYCHFIGKVNKIKFSTPRSGESGSVDIECASHIRELTRINSAKKSDESQKRRSGDRFRRHIGVANVKIFWGQEHSRPGNSGAKNSQPPPGPGGGRGGPNSGGGSN